MAGSASSRCSRKPPPPPLRGWPTSGSPSTTCVSSCVRPVADTVKDTTNHLRARPGRRHPRHRRSTSTKSANRFNAAIDYTNPTGVVFHGEGTVQSHAADAHRRRPRTSRCSTRVREQRSPESPLRRKPSTSSHRVRPRSALTAFDANNAGDPVALVPINWSTSRCDGLLQSPNSGILTTTGKRGTVTVTAS